MKCITCIYEDGYTLYHQISKLFPATVNSFLHKTIKVNHHYFLTLISRTEIPYLIAIVILFYFYCYNVLVRV